MGGRIFYFRKSILDDLLRNIFTSPSSIKDLDGFLLSIGDALKNAPEKILVQKIKKTNR
jgi:hypothetical protein